MLEFYHRVRVRDNLFYLVMASNRKIWSVNSDHEVVEWGLSMGIYKGFSISIHPVTEVYGGAWGLAYDHATPVGLAPGFLNIGVCARAKFRCGHIHSM